MFAVPNPAYAVYQTFCMLTLSLRDRNDDGLKSIFSSPFASFPQAAPVLIADGTILVQPCEIGNFIAMVGKGSPRNVALCVAPRRADGDAGDGADVDTPRAPQGAGIYTFPTDAEAGQSYEVLYYAPEWAALTKTLAVEVPGPLQQTLSNARCCIGTYKQLRTTFPCAFSCFPFSFHSSRNGVAILSMLFAYFVRLCLYLVRYGMLLASADTCTDHVKLFIALLTRKSVTTAGTTPSLATMNTFVNSDRPSVRHGPKVSRVSSSNRFRVVPVDTSHPAPTHPPLTPTRTHLSLSLCVLSSVQAIFCSIHDERSRCCARAHPHTMRTPAHVIIAALLLRVPPQSKWQK